jgi:hypothetical protein
MSEMIERVAKAIEESIWEPGQDSVIAARAAIEAMREPTEAMLEAASIEAQKPAGWHMVYRNIHRAMIDAALKSLPL